MNPMTQAKAPWRGKTFKDLVTDAKARITETTRDQLAQWQAENKPVVIVDVRETVDFENGHIPGAISLPRGILELEADEILPNQDATIVVYCGGGSRSALAADTLQVMGYNAVYSLQEGYRGYKHAQG